MSSIRQSERLQGQRLERQHGATAARAGARRAAAAQQQQQHQLQQHETTRRRRRCSGGGSGGYGACSRLVLLAALLLACCAAGAGPAAALQQQPSPAPADAAARTRANRQLEALDAALPGAAAAGGPAAAAKLQEVHEAPRITIEEQLQQAEALNVQLTQEQLARANPLLGTAGRLKDPERKRPADWPDGCVVCMYVCAAALAGGPGGCFGFSAACLFLDHAGLNTVVHTTQQHITSITHTHTHTQSTNHNVTATLRSARSSRTSTARTCASGSSTTASSARARSTSTTTTRRCGALAMGWREGRARGRILCVVRRMGGRGRRVGGRTCSVVCE